MSSNQDVSEESKELVRNFYAKLDSCRGNDVELKKAYKELSSQYDEVIKIIATPFELIVKHLVKVLERKDAEKIKVLDVGTGTGLLMQTLHEKGFRNIEGLDPSEEMLEIARKRGIFTKLHQVPMTENPTPNMADNTYDVITCAGCFVEGHIPMEAIFEMVRITRSDGHLVLVIYDPNYTLNYMEVFGKAIKKKLVELIHMERIPYKREYRNDFSYVFGHIVVLQVL